MSASPSHSASAMDRVLLAVGAMLAVISIAALVIPLAVILTPFIGNVTGLFRVGISANEAGLRFIGLAGILGGAGLIGSIWIVTSVRRKL